MTLSHPCDRTTLSPGTAGGVQRSEDDSDRKGRQTMPTPFQAMVLDHRSDDWRQADSKPELGRLLFGYVLGNGQKYPPRPNDVRFLAVDATLTGTQAVELVRSSGAPTPFVYRAEDGTRREGELYWSKPTRRVRIR